MAQKSQMYEKSRNTYRVGGGNSSIWQLNIKRLNACNVMLLPWTIFIWCGLVGQKPSVTHTLEVPQHILKTNHKIMTDHWINGHRFSTKYTENRLIGYNIIW